MAGEDSLEAVRGQALEVARGWSLPGAPASWELTATMFSVLAQDDALLRVASEIPVDRLPALLFCAAARHLVTSRGEPTLAGYFPVAGGAQPNLDAGFGPAFRAFCLEHRAELLALCHRRRYQMNEVARSMQVGLALGVVGQAHPGLGLALIDVGSGAGLGLHVDRYHYRLSDGRRFGDAESPLELHGEVEGILSPPVTQRLPPIAIRIGIDLDPVDLSDPDAKAWLRSCIPPEVGSLARFDAASEVALGHGCHVRRGDAVEALPELLDEVPADHLPVVVDTYTAVFLSDGQRARFGEVLRDRGGHRDLVWISLDPLVPLGTTGRYSVQGLGVSEELVGEYQQRGVFALLGVLAFGEGRASGELLARAHPSGTRFAWLDPGTASRRG